MRQSKSYKIRWLAKLPLLLLYMSFFIVQLFYNFDIAALVSAKPYLAVQKNDANANSRHHAAIKKATTPTDKKEGVRLNKRYHPQPAITCHTAVMKRLVCYVSSKLHVHYSRGFIPSSLRATHSLRGPPNVV